KLYAVGLRTAGELYPRELSGGMARRVALARALALDPPLMVYDEPLTGLDPIASGVIMSLISRLNDSLGLTSVIVTHHVHETLPVADRAIVIANGKIVFSGTPAELEATDDPLVLQFLRGEPDGPIAFDTAERDRESACCLSSPPPAPSAARACSRCRCCARGSRPRTSSPSWCARSTRSVHARCRSWRSAAPSSACR